MKSYDVKTKCTTASARVVAGLVCAALLAVPYAVLADAPAGLTVSGVYTYVVYPDRHPPPYTARYRFRAQVLGGRWVIGYEDLASATNPALVNVRATASCDGTNIYFVQFQSQSGVSNAWGARYEAVRPKLATTLAEIFPGTYPPPKEPTLQRLWLPFASRSVLGAPRGIAKPPFSVDLAIFYETDYQCGYYWSDDGPGGQMRQIVLTNAGSVLHRDSTDGKIRRRQLAPPYDKGYVEGVGVYERTTNVEEALVPLQFKFTAYSPQFKIGGAPALSRVYTYTCVVTDCYPSSIGPIPAPLPRGRVLVTDRRFERDGWSQLDYIATNGWLEAGDPLIIARKKNTLKSSLNQEVLSALNISPGRIHWLRYAICVLLVLPLGLVVLRGLVQKLKREVKGKA